MKFEIWMGEHYSRFDHGLVHLKDGRSLPLKAWIHVATYGADSVLIADEERYVGFPFLPRMPLPSDPPQTEALSFRLKNYVLQK